LEPADGRMESEPSQAAASSLCACSHDHAVASRGGCLVCKCARPVPSQPTTSASVGLEFRRLADFGSCPVVAVDRRSHWVRCRLAEVQRFVLQWLDTSRGASLEFLEGTLSVEVCAIIEDGTSRAECRANGMLAWEMLGVLGRPWKLESGEHSQPESDDASGQIPVLWQDSATRSYTQELLRLARQHGCLVVTRQWQNSNENGGVTSPKYAVSCSAGVELADVAANLMDPLMREVSAQTDKLLLCQQYFKPSQDQATRIRDIKVAGSTIRTRVLPYTRLRVLQMKAHNPATVAHCMLKKLAPSSVVT